jgi:hypothetical protein
MGRVLGSHPISTIIPTISQVMTTPISIACVVPRPPQQAVRRDTKLEPTYDGSAGL